MVPCDGLKEMLQCLPTHVQEKFMDIYMLQYLPPHLQEKFLDRLSDKIGSHLMNHLPSSSSSSSSSSSHSSSLSFSSSSSSSSSPSPSMQGGPLVRTSSLRDVPASTAVAASAAASASDDYLPKLSIEHVGAAMHSIQSTWAGAGGTFASSSTSASTSASTSTSRPCFVAGQPVSMITAAIGAFLLSESCKS